MTIMRFWPHLGGLVFASLLAVAGQAQAADSGYLVVSSGAIGQADASVVLVDTGSIAHSGDEVTASMVMVVVEPDLGRVQGVSYMLGRERLSCRDRTAQTLHVEVYSEGGAKIAEFDGSEPPQRIEESTAWWNILNRTCRGASLVDAGATPFASLDDGVSAVRASVDAARAAQAAMTPHRFEPVGLFSRNGARSTLAFIDQAQLEHDGAALTRWTLLAHATPRMEDEAAVAYDLVQLSFDCATRRSRVRVWMSFGADDALVRSSVELGPWQDVGVGEDLPARQLAAVCGSHEGPAQPSFDSIAAALTYMRTQMSGGPARIS